MDRIAVTRLVEVLLCTLIGYALWCLAYEIVVAWRFAPSLYPGEGSSRWALLKAQQAFSWPEFFTLAPTHFWARLWYPATKAEALIRGGMAVAVLAATAIVLVVTWFVTRPQTPFGSARFGSLAEAARGGLAGPQGIILGTMNGVTIRSDDPAHILVVGPSRSGKGTGFVLPNGYAWLGSAVFFDPKGENYEHLASHRKALGQDVFFFAPGMHASHRYNPLDYVRRDAMMATDCLVVASFIIPEKSDDTWAGAGRLLLSALIGYTLSSKLTVKIRHMRGVARMTVSGQDISAVLRAIVKTEGSALPSWVIDSFNQYIALEPETRNSAVFNVNLSMSLWNNGLISAATETSDFDLRQLRRKPTTIFIGCTIAQLSIFRPLIRILLQQIHDVLMETIPGKDEPHQVLLMLDEFAQVGRMDSLISKITISAGYGFRMALIVQDLAQLDEIYGKAIRTTTVSGSHIKLFIQINDDETAKYVSGMLGERTVRYTTPLLRGGQGPFAARGSQPHLIPRPLRTPLELREMSDRVAILMVRNSRSFEVGKIRHYADRPYRRLYQAYKGRMPDVPELPDWVDVPGVDLGPARPVSVSPEVPKATAEVEPPPRRSQSAPERATPAPEAPDELDDETRPPSWSLPKATVPSHEKPVAPSEDRASAASAAEEAAGTAKPSRGRTANRKPRPSARTKKPAAPAEPTAPKEEPVLPPSPPRQRNRRSLSLKPPPETGSETYSISAIAAAEESAGSDALKAMQMSAVLEASMDRPEPEGDRIAGLTTQSATFGDIEARKRGGSAPRS
ncbi:type IV secretory system conjugative DNA transfer family protein (plasmid) [Methylobacterium radiotolerans]|jgi:type IV secretion system protein VirD4